MSSWRVSFEFSFCGEKTGYTHAIAVNKRANSHHFKIKNLNLPTITFLSSYLLNRGKSSSTFRKIIECFLGKHCRDSPCQTSSVAFSKVYLRFSSVLTRSWIDWCQIVTVTCKNNVSKLIGSLLNHLYHYANKCFGEASLFNLHYLYFNYHLLAQKLFSLWKILL